jgi:hypothetical protein
MHYITIDIQKVSFEPKTMYYTNIDPQKDKDSNTRPCTTPLTPKRQRFGHMTLHYTTNDPQKSKIRTYKPTMHYAPLFTPKKSKTIDLQ